MNFKYLLIFFVFGCCLSITAQKVSFNAELLANVSVGEDGSDIWGFEKDGIKYAIMGSAKKTSVFSLEDPANPVLRYTATGVQSIWRDMKTWNDHIYVTADQGTDGLVIIDMSGAPEMISHVFYKPELTVGIETKNLQRCHNLYIDEKGFAYLSGCNISQRGILIFDLNQDPNAPVYLGAADLNYSHDAFTRGDTLYTSEINIGKLGIYDVSDRTNPKLLATQSTSRNFTHNAWPSDDGKYVFTTDEKSFAYVDAYDITDLNNIRLLDKFRPLDRQNDGVIPHNTHYYNGYLVTSWYTDGIRIVDAHKPDNLIEVAYYDTWENPTTCNNGFNGCWGAFPFTNSGWVYGSDIQNGLYIINVDYKRACYLEGSITSTTNEPIANANIHIVSDQLNEDFSNPAGMYKTGQALEGSFTVVVTHPDYETVQTSASLVAGEVTILDVQMTKKLSVNVSFSVKDQSGAGVDAKLILRDGKEVNSFNIASTGLSTAVKSSSYELFLNAWGSQPIYNPTFVVDANTSELEVTVASGYYDQFESDLGWTVNSTAGMAGAWVRAIPNQTEYIGGEIANPGTDSADDGKLAFVTGNGIRGAGCDDVDNGVSELISPEMDLTTYIDPTLNYDVWFFNNGGNTALNDTLVIKLTNGTDEVIVDKIYGGTAGWKEVREINVKSFITPTETMQLIVEVSDQSGAGGHLVEAGFDNFFVSENTSNVEDNITSLSTIAIAPNPVADRLLISLSDKKAIKASLGYGVFNAVGSQVLSGKIGFHSTQLDVSDLAAGMYYITIDGHKTSKFVKM